MILEKFLDHLVQMNKKYWLSQKDIKASRLNPTQLDILRSFNTKTKIPHCLIWLTNRD
jgi:hypothetical protein